MWVVGRLVSGNGIENDIQVGTDGTLWKALKEGKGKAEKRDAGRWPCVCGVLIVSIFPFTIGRWMVGDASRFSFSYYFKTPCIDSHRQRKARRDETVARGERGNIDKRKRGGGRMQSIASYLYVRMKLLR